MDKDKVKKKPKERHGKKVSDVEMESYLRKNGGLYARTARDIQRVKGVPFTRQEVKQWCDGHPDVMADVKEESIDIAEETLQEIMRKAPPNVRLRAAEIFLKTQGKHRGYVERTETEFSTKDKITLEII
jgi:hypothetical protein